MAIHVCRGFESNHQMPDSMLYLMTLFLTGVLNYSYVGSTGSFSVMGTQGSLNPANYLTSRGVSASINLGASLERAVAIPSSSHTVTSADVGRILALRSTAYPRHNSGLFRVTSVNTASNYLFIDYQSSGSNPPAEVSALSFHLFVSEYIFIANSSSNSQANGRYRGDRDAGCSRVILQSPHSSSWQVRLAREPSVVWDHSGVSYNGGCPISIAPGMNGSIYGDFASGSLDVGQPGGEHLHGEMWFDSQTFERPQLRVGTGTRSTVDTTSTIQFYAWGDDSTGSTIFAYKVVSGTYGVAGTSGQWCGFGMADEDGETLPPKTVQRLFAFGCSYSSINNLQENSHINWRFGPPFQAGNTTVAPSLYTGISYGLNNKPVSAIPAPYVEVGGFLTEMTNDDDVRPHIIDVSFAVDNALLGQTELQAVDLYAGTIRSRVINEEVDTSDPEGVRPFEYDPRRMGLFPIARFGRSNFGRWVTTTDVDRSWIHLGGGVYMPWGGPAAK